MYFNFAGPLFFIIAAVAFILISLGISRLLQPRLKSVDKETTYECGETPVGNSWIQFNIRFYVIALIFIIFDVEVVFMVPWAVVFKELGTFAYVEMVIFIVILLVGLAYAWRKGDLEWDKPRTDMFTREAAPELYEDEKTEDEQVAEELTI